MRRYEGDEKRTKGMNRKGNRKKKRKMRSSHHGAGESDGRREIIISITILTLQAERLLGRSITRSLRPSNLNRDRLQV